MPKIASQSDCFHEIAINVLGYRESSQWIALALEMDLRGYGDTFEDACRDLDDHIQMQIGFAGYKGDMDMIFHPAESMYFQLFSQVRDDRLRNFTRDRNVDPEYYVGNLPLPDPHVIAELQKGFAGGNAS